MDTGIPCPRCGGRARRLLGHAGEYWQWWTWYACACGYDDLDPEIEAALEPREPYDADEIGAP